MPYEGFQRWPPPDAALIERTLEDDLSSKRDEIALATEQSSPDRE
ncbi:hypothetical protein GRAN_2031 [Granulicella sibirica]|uniref:Uncharacterized protein n=1 Tax=Granulicella sibirica TaxID=2479048 RepID=A0A4Q0TAP5_9BACT|nr:hypothetical protein GRAN_2031 [Granulicella sibirica]